MLDKTISSSQQVNIFIYIILVACRVTEYSHWSPCSVTCGKGIRMRTRHYVDPIQAQKSDCNQQLVSKEMCSGQLPDCGYDLVSVIYLTNVK